MSEHAVAFQHMHDPIMLALSVVPAQTSQVAPLHEIFTVLLGI